MNMNVIAQASVCLRAVGAMLSWLRTLRLQSQEPRTIAVPDFRYPIRQRLPLAYVRWRMDHPMVKWLASCLPAWTSRLVLRLSLLLLLGQTPRIWLVI